MFYCDECARKNDWPESILSKSYGPCEMCGRKRVCNNVKSSALPEPKKRRTENA